MHVLYFCCVYARTVCIYELYLMCYVCMFLCMFCMDARMVCMVGMSVSVCYAMYIMYVVLVMYGVSARNVFHVCKLLMGVCMLCM